MERKGTIKRKKITVDHPDIFLVCPVSHMTLDGVKVKPHRLRPVILCKNEATLTAWCAAHMSRAFSSDYRLVKKFMEAVNGSNGKASKRVR